MTVREIVLRLAADLAEHARGDVLKMGFEPRQSMETSQIQRLE
jgi:hypothetical protein